MLARRRRCCARGTGIGARRLVHWDGIPDNEKYFMFHVLYRSLVPVPMLDENRAVCPEYILFASNWPLLPERHHPNCSCVCVGDAVEQITTKNRAWVEYRAEHTAYSKKKVAP